MNVARRASGAQAWLEIDLDALAHNVSTLKQQAGGAAIAAVIKANGYGLGALPIGETAIAAGAQRVCVYNVDEALALREYGFDGPILLMGTFTSWQVERVLDLQVAVTLTQIPMVDSLAKAAVARGLIVPVHVKVETGLYRLAAPPETALQIVALVQAAPGLVLEGFCSHLPSADGADPKDTEDRFQQFLDLAAQVQAPVRHIANTAAVLQFPQTALEMVRAGAGIYGIAPGSAGPPERHGLHQVLRWRAAVVQVHDVPAGAGVSYGATWIAPRDSRIAVVSVGYEDGFRRSLSNRGVLLLQGVRVPVVGTVCMDMCLVDITDGPQAQIGDLATVIGEDGEAQIRLDEIATLCDTIPYEILTGLGARLPRIYCRGGKPVLVQTPADRIPVPTNAADPAMAV